MADLNENVNLLEEIEKLNSKHKQLTDQLQEINLKNSKLKRNIFNINDAISVKRNKIKLIQTDCMGIVSNIDKINLQHAKTTALNEYELNQFNEIKMQVAESDRKFDTLAEKINEQLFQNNEKIIEEENDAKIKLKNELELKLNELKEEMKERLSKIANKRQEIMIKKNRSAAHLIRMRKGLEQANEQHKILIDQLYKLEHGSDETTATSSTPDNDE